jgi:DNA-binding PadR family transcriptional regulator
MTCAEIVILATIMKRGKHGYEIKKSAERIFGDTYTINNNTLYANLHKFQGTGAVKSEVQPVPGKPDRHVYSITEKGREIFRELVLDFNAESARNDMDFYARVAFFHLLEPAERSKILQTRKNVMEERSDRYGKLREACLARNLGYEEKVVGFMREQTENELQWIASIESAVEK